MLYEESENSEVSLAEVLRWVNFIYGGEDALFTDPVKEAGGFYKYAPLDVDRPGRRGALNRLKLKAQNSDQTILMFLKNNMMQLPWRNHMINCRGFCFKCVFTNTIIESGVVQWFVLSQKASRLTKIKVLKLNVDFDKC